MKRLFLVIMILVFMFELTGCEAIQQKFTRKKKRKPIRPVFYQEGEGETRPHLELYMMHYTYWKTWQEDLIANAGENSKRDKLASEEILGNLKDMRKHLVDEKGKELDAYIEEIEGITDKITKGIAGQTTQIATLKRRLSNIRARIVRKFYYKKVRDYIKAD